MQGRTRLGLTYGRVELVVDDWEAEARRVGDALRERLGETATVEHVGATAVPGLLAKPILDFAVGMAPGVEIERVIPLLEALGYEYRGDAGEEGGFVFVLEDAPLHRIAHVHAVPHGGAQWRRYLAFRDRLRSDAEARASYAELKRKLAHRYPEDRRSYTAAKAAFIARLLGDA